MAPVTVEGSASELPVASVADEDADGPSAPPGASEAPTGRRAQVERLISAIRDSDRAAVDDAVLRLSRSRRWLAPLALAIGAFAMLLEGVRLLFTNWRLTLIQVLPAMWIWAAMLDLKAHVLHGKSFHVITGPVVTLVVLVVAAITAASYFLNAVSAFAIAQPGPPLIRPAFTRAVPARLIGMKTTYSKRDKLAATAVGGAIGAVVCTPPYVLGRIGLLMLGSHTLFILISGVVVFAIGLTLQAGATSAVKAVKMSAKLVSGNRPEPGG
jgi:hypothetical protein